MDFERELDNLHHEQEALRLRIATIDDKFKAAKEFTTKFLEICAKRKLTKVSIGRSHKSIPSSIGFPFGASGSIFGIGQKKDSDGWPLIWGACEEAKIGAGCGNTDQHQADTSKLIDGTYHLLKGKWIKID